MTKIDELIAAKKAIILDPYGLETLNLKGEVSEGVTEYDSFITEDALRLLLSSDLLESCKNEMKHKISESTGLYVVTLLDVNTEYYKFATMLNRLTNKDYSKKVYRSVNLFQDLLRGVKKNYTDLIKKEIENSDAHISYENKVYAL